MVIMAKIWKWHTFLLIYTDKNLVTTCLIVKKAEKWSLEECSQIPRAIIEKNFEGKLELS